VDGVFYRDKITALNRTTLELKRVWLQGWDVEGFALNRTTLELKPSYGLWVLQGTRL